MYVPRAMGLAAGLMIIPLLSQQEAPSVVILRGELLKWDPAGSLSIASKDRRVSQCRFDDNTFFSRDGNRVAASEVKPGMLIEAVADFRRGSDHCYAPTVYVLERPPSSDTMKEYRSALDDQRHVLDHIFPRGRLTFSGVVLESTPERLLLKLRSGERRSLRLREDTRFTKDGIRADASMLEVNARVFVRAGEGIDGALEAYQVVRGQIVTPP